MRLHVSGMNQLLWYYADLEKQACLNDTRPNNNSTTNMQALSGRRSNKMAFERDDKIVIEINHCLAYRKFAKYGKHLGEMEIYHLQ